MTAGAPPELRVQPRVLSALVTAVFDRWRAAGIAFLVLRNYEQLPQETGNDIDVLIQPHQMQSAEQELIAAAREVGYRLHNRAEFSPVSLFLSHPASRQQIQFDLFSKLVWRGLELIPTPAVLERRRARDNFFIPDSADETVINLLTRLVYHGAVREKYRPAIAASLTAEAGRVRERLALTFGADLASQIVTRAAAGDWDGVGQLGGRLRRALVWRQVAYAPLRTLASWASDLRRLLRRAGQLPGITVVLVGADGCGKSTLATQATQALAGTFHENKSCRVHWKPAVFLRKRRAERPPTTNPHGQPPRGPWPSALMLAYHWSEFLAGYWLQLRPVLFRNGLVLVDRYHYDFVVDPRRFRLTALPRLARALFRLLPEPDLIFVLDAPPEVLHARKPEVSLAETARQCEAYRTEVGRRPNACVVDATQPADAVATEVVSRILLCLADRQSRRSGLSQSPAHPAPDPRAPKL
jgi:thymidylate kinase